MKKKLSVLIASALALATLATGCLSTTQTPGASSSTPQNPASSSQAASSSTPGNTQARVFRIGAVSNPTDIMAEAGQMFCDTMQKGMHTLLGAFHTVLKKNLNVRLVIIGSDNGNRIENLVNISSTFATHVSFLGLISKEELEKWYSVADIGVIPSYYEQCPYVGIEMMMHGLPIVASDGFGLRNMFQDGINALIASIGNREYTEEFSCNLAKAIEELFSSEELRKALGRNAREIYHSYYSEKQMLKGYKDLLTSLD